MSGALSVTIVTPEGRLLEVQQAQKVRVRLADGGWLSVYPRHAPLIGEILPGAVQITTGEGEIAVPVGPGLVQVLPDQVLVLVDRSEGAFDAGSAGVDVGDGLRFERLAHELLSVLRAGRDGPGQAGSALGSELLDELNRMP